MRQTTVRVGGLDFAYDDRVLRPRPWTAHQSGWAAELLRDAPEGPVLELCAGVGHIGLVAIAEVPRRLVAVDVDPVASAFCRSNAEAAGLEDLVEVRTGPMAEMVRPGERFALVIADPPWMPSALTERYPQDPLLAIDGGASGLELAEQCLAVAAGCLAPGASVLLQVGTREQADLVAASERDLAATEVREYDDGVLVRLVPSSG